MWNINRKETNKTKTNSKIQATEWWLKEGMGIGKDDMGKGGQMHGDDGN